MKVYPSSVLLVAIPSFIQGISTKLVEEQEDRSIAPSQSLLLFRAFQQNPHLFSQQPCKVAIPSFIQGISTISPWFRSSWSASRRNPFFYSGHFNLRYLLRSKWEELRVAIPSFIQGISTYAGGRYLVIALLSQSLPLFRAFQLSVFS